MPMPPPRLGIVTATVDRKRAEPCLQSWLKQANERPPLTVVTNDDRYTGSVPAFRRGVDRHLKEYGSEIICCFHDDLVVLDEGWDQELVTFFDEHQPAGLVGFAGTHAVGTPDLYETPYSAGQLAALDHVGSLIDWSTEPCFPCDGPERVVAVDGCAQIGRRPFWLGYTEKEWRTRATTRLTIHRPWAQLEAASFHHHFADRALGCLARRGGWEVYVIPIRARHLGGQTIGHASYQQWAATQTDGGNRGLWEAAHRIGYDTFRDVLPLRL